MMLSYWFAHIVLMWSTVLIGVALAGEVYVGFLDPYPTGYGILGSLGLMVFLGTIWLLQAMVEGRDTTRQYHHWRVRLFGIVMAIVLLLVHSHVPSVVGNLVWAIALFSQIAWPLILAVRDLYTADEA